MLPLIDLLSSSLKALRLLSSCCSLVTSVPVITCVSVIKPKSCLRQAQCLRAFALVPRLPLSPEKPADAEPAWLREASALLDIESDDSPARACSGPGAACAARGTCRACAAPMRAPAWSKCSSPPTAAMARRGAGGAPYGRRRHVRGGAMGRSRGARQQVVRGARHPAPRRASIPQAHGGVALRVRRVPTPAACVRAMSQTLSFQPPKPPHPLPCTTPSSKLARSSGANLRRARRQPDQRKARAW